MTDPLDGSDPINIRAWLRDLVYREIHAIVLGFVPGLLCGLWWSPVTQQAVVAIVAIALGLRAAPGPLKDVKQEPWYALAALVIGLVAGRAVVLAGLV